MKVFVSKLWFSSLVGTKAFLCFGQSSFITYHIDKENSFSENQLFGQPVLDQVNESQMEILGENVLKQDLFFHQIALS